jgi:glycosyltransferase involved in cell wall biosynthesis
MAKFQNDVAAEAAAIRASGLFLSDWYLAGRKWAGGDGVEDFCIAGWREGAQPNPYFMPGFYLAQNPDVAAAGFNPLWHYIFFGEFEGRPPCPFFDPVWYREQYAIGPRELCLRHFLARRFTGQVNPVPVFDAAYYLENNPDVAAGGADPFEHFLGFGAAEGRNPAADFDVAFYVNRYGALLDGQNPLLHYLANRDDGKYFPQRPVHEKLIPGAVRLATRPSAQFEEFQPLPASAVPEAKLLAYYLPQFHHVPENEAWWGKGFTDWTNLARALPRYGGHLQPRVPRDLGYYSLDDPATLRKQIALAKGAGLSGFVFYFYWFNRRRLLEGPLEQLLADASLEFPFCVMWANENWTRRWDGMDREVLIAQEYRESDDAELVACFARLFADARYIRVQGRPLLMIYRMVLVPDAAKRLRRWRELFKQNHNEEPVIVMAQSLEDYDPAPYGLDGAVEFPPHKLSQACKTINDKLDLFDHEFGAAVYDYGDIANASLALKAPDYPLIKTILPGWDNDPRREGKGLVLHDTSPAKYQAWLRELVDYTAKNPFFGERIICVNAWNEWAEGAFLEPDLHFGAAFLNASGRALCPRQQAGLDAGILLVGHDAQPHGSQMMLLHLARHFSRTAGLKVHVLLLGVGPLMSKYTETASVTVAYVRAIIEGHLDTYREMGITTAIVNSAASARVVPLLAERGIQATLLVHEMPRILKEYNLEMQARLGAARAANVVFASAHVSTSFAQAVDLPKLKPTILAQGNYQNIAFDPGLRARIRQALGIADAAFMVLGAGFADMRKGFDLFLQMAAAASARRDDVHFVWVGEINFTLKTYLGPEMARAGAGGRFHHIGFTEAVQGYFSAADVYALTSREDPYPTVALEALACGAPVVAFDESGGIPDFLRSHDSGLVAKPADTADFLTQIEVLLDHDTLDARRPALIALAKAAFSFPRYAEDLLRIAHPALQTVSACVLNYNYARYLAQRLRSVFAQTYPVKEVLFFDDASQDGSVATAAMLAGKAGREMRVIANAKNAGAFAQWRRAAETAAGDYVWIAEADDECAPEFLSRLVAAMNAADTPLLAFADSKAIDETGQTVMPSYRSYYFESGAPELAASGVWPADEFARRFLSERNLILNVSAVLWRRTALLAALQACADIADWRIAGDWRLYLEVLTAQAGSVVYVAEPLNTHRRHQAGVTQSLDADLHVAEIARMHGVAAKKLGLKKAEKDRQAAYLERIKAQLGAGQAPKPHTAAKARKTGNAGAAILARRRKV